MEPLAVRKKKFFDTLESEGIKKDIIEAFKAVDPIRFFDKMFQDKFYTNDFIPVGYGEKSDSIYLAAKMINALSPAENMRILEVGTGSGFSTAVLSLLCREVFTIEMDERLAASAKTRLYALGYENIRFFSGDGTDPEMDLSELDSAIIWGACYKRPISTLQYVKRRGVMVFPMGPEHMQQIVIIRNEPDVNTGANFKMSFGEQGIFPPIHGKYGYDKVLDIGSEIMVETNELDELPEEKDK